MTEPNSVAEIDLGMSNKRGFEPESPFSIPSHFRNTTLVTIRSKIKCCNSLDDEFSNTCLSSSEIYLVMQRMCEML